MQLRPRRSRKTTCVSRGIIGAVFAVLLLNTIFLSDVRAGSSDNLPPLLKAQLDSLYRPTLDPQQVRQIEKPITLQRDAACFVFEAGTLTFFAPVRGRVTGMLFSGQVTFELTPPTRLEKQQLARFTGDTVRTCLVSELYFRFTDNTCAELQAKTTAKSVTEIKRGDRPPNKYAKWIADELNYAMGSRLLIELYNDSTSSFFYAAIDPEDDTRYHYLIEPLEDEAVKLFYRPSGSKLHDLDLACSWPLPADLARANGQTAQVDNRPLESRHYRLNTTINEPSHTAITAELTFVPRRTQLRAARFTLAAYLDIDSVVCARQPAFYVFSDPGYPTFGRHGVLDVFWAKPLPVNEEIRIAFSYQGKYLLYLLPWGDFVINETTRWYPTSDWQSRTTYELNYDYSSSYELISVGEKLSETTDSDRKHASWRMDYPVKYVSFNYGHFEDLTMPDEPGLPEVTIYRGKNHTGDMLSKDMKEKVGHDIMGAIGLFTDCFGPLPFDHLAATEIPGSHGQGFPQLLHLAWSSFQQEREGSTELFRAHEVAHQWWGHLVGWKTYHDQWLSEGFAEYSGALYVEEKYGWGKEMREILKRWRRTILQRGGRRSWHDGPEVAPIWMGRRCSSYDSPASYSALVYNKGAYVLHMLRMMLRNFKTGSDEKFCEVMRAFVRTYRDRSASTEDFQRTLESQLGGSMNWFFDQWVYGTEIPRLKYKKKITETEDGHYLVTGRIEQSEVSKPFRLFLPITLDFGGGQRSTFVQEITETVTTFTTPPLPIKPKRVIFNDYQTILTRN